MGGGGDGWQDNRCEPKPQYKALDDHNMECAIEQSQNRYALQYEKISWIFRIYFEDKEDPRAKNPKECSIPPKRKGTVLLPF